MRLVERPALSPYPVLTGKDLCCWEQVTLPCRRGICTAAARPDPCVRWYEFVSNQQLFRETDSRPISSIVRQRQLRLYGHVARYPEANPAYRVVSVRDNPTWRRPRGRPQKSWLQQVDASCWESLGMGRELAWRVAGVTARSGAVG